MYEWVAILAAGAVGGWVQTMLVGNILYLPQLASAKGARVIQFGGFREIGLGAVAAIVNWGTAPGVSFADLQLHPQAIAMAILAGAAGPALWRYYTQAYLAGVHGSRENVENPTPEPPTSNSD